MFLLGSRFTSYGRDGRGLFHSNLINQDIVIISLLYKGCCFRISKAIARSLSGRGGWFLVLLLVEVMVESELIW